MSPLQKYQQDLQAGRIVSDPEQRLVVEHLQRVYLGLQSQGRAPGSVNPLRWIGLGRASLEPPLGLYLWGGVGRGKTYLMDLLYDTIHEAAKHRTHFHRFMQRVHQQLTRAQGQRNPLQVVADQWAAEAKLLCFDEFFVLDIGDAMILAGLLEALFERGVVLVATSNLHPDDLYRDGLQRERFLPAIELIKRYTELVEIGGGTDFRLRNLEQTRLYHTPIDEQTEALLQDSAIRLAPDRLDEVSDGELTVLGRPIPFRWSAGDVIWFSFAALCDGPRSAQDYVEIARCYHALILSDVPALTDERSEQVRRFINLVDELYDRRVKLIIAAQVPMAELYRGERLAFEFGRTLSRLSEMQSVAYLGSGHRA